MSQLAQPVPPPPPPPPAGVIVCAPAASATPAGQVCDASPPAGPSPPTLPSPPQLRASLCAQEAPLDLSAAAATATTIGRSQELVQKVKVEQAKEEKEQHPLDEGSNILRSQLNMQREMQAIPTAEHEKMEYNDCDLIVAEGPEQKRWKPADEPHYPEHVPQRLAVTEEPGSGGHYQRMPRLFGGPQYRDKLPLLYQHQEAPLPPGHHTLPPPPYTALEPQNLPQHPREGYMSPIHVQIPGYPHGPVHKKLPAPYPGDCGPRDGSAFSRHPRAAGLLSGRDHDSEVRRMNYQAAWALMRDSEQRKPEMLTISMLMQPTPSSGVPPLVPPQMGRYSPNRYGLAPQAGQIAPLPHWAPTNWMASPSRPVQQATPPEVSSAEGGVVSPHSAMSQSQSQAQGKNPRPFKAFNYDEHLGEPITPEGKLGRLPQDTRENYESFLRNKRAQIPLPSIDLKARKNEQSPDGDPPSPTEENADVAAYKARRQKNNLAAKRSRAARHIKEDDIAITSMYFCELIKEYRHSLGVQKLITQQLERQLASTAFFRQ